MANASAQTNVLTTKDIHWSPEQPDILFSAGGIKQAENFFKNEENFMVINADSLFLLEDPQRLKVMLQEHEKSRALATLHVCEHPGAGREFGGVWGNKDGVVQHIGFKDETEETNELKPSGPYHFTGVYILNHRVFDLIPPGRPFHIFSGVLSPLLHENCVRFFFEKNILWFELGDEQNYLKATQKCLNILNDSTEGFKNILLKIFKRYSHSRGDACDLTSKPNGTPYLFGRDSIVEEGADLQGFVVLGAGQKIPAGARVENAVIASDQDLKSTHIIKNQFIL